MTPQRAAELLAQGRLVALPTETVYGLGADACQDAAVARMVAAKGRPADAAQQLGEFVDELRLTPEGWRLAKRQARFLFQR